MDLQFLNGLLKINRKLKFSHGWGHYCLILTILQFANFNLTILIINCVPRSAAHSAAWLTKILFLSHFLQIDILISSFLAPSAFFFSISRTVCPAIHFHSISSESWLIIIFNNSSVLFSLCLCTSQNKVLIEIILC
jgi:hypothetical protein